jgi:hypothetical protein
LPLTKFKPMFPFRNELQPPQVPVTEEDFNGAAFVAEVAVNDRCSEGFFELLFAFCVPAFEERLEIPRQRWGTAG